jgi:integrase
MKVTAIIKGRVDQNGHRPVQIRIANGNQTKYKPTQIKINPETQFKEGRIVNHPNAKEYNKKLENLIIQYQAQALSGFEKKATKVKLIDYINSKIRHLDREPSTFRQYAVQIGKLADFGGNVFLDEIDHGYFNGYKQYLKGLGNDNNTIWNSFKFLKGIIKFALADKILKEDPRHNYEFPKYKDPTKTYLTPAEMAAIEKFIKTKVPPDLKESGTWFLIGCYSGLRISDIVTFDKDKHIVNGRLIYQQTQKTKEAIGMPVDGKLKEYLQMVKYQPLSMHPNTYNKLIKVVASLSGIKKHLTAHVSRHTAAMRMADAGVRKEVAAKVLGIKSEKTLSIYYKITNPGIDNELKKLKR